MVWIILIGIAAFIIIKFSIDYNNKKVENFAMGGLRARLPEWVLYFINSGFTIYDETDSKILFHRSITGEITGKSYELYIELECVIANILSGYVITTSGAKIKSENIEFRGSDNMKNIENIEQITRRVIASLESKGVM